MCSFKYKSPQTEVKSIEFNIRKEGRHVGHELNTRNKTCCSITYIAELKQLKWKQFLPSISQKIRLNKKTQEKNT